MFPVPCTHEISDNAPFSHIAIQVTQQNISCIFLDKSATPENMVLATLAKVAHVLRFLHFSAFNFEPQQSHDVINHVWWQEKKECGALDICSGLLALISRACMLYSA